jgi:hypothetical protein
VKLKAPLVSFFTFHFGISDITIRLLATVPVEQSLVFKRSLLSELPEFLAGISSAGDTFEYKVVTNPYLDR